MERTTLHIVCEDSRSRAEQARIAFALGHHAEVYSELDELLDQSPSEGIVFACDDGRPGIARDVIDRLAESGMWLPVVFTASEPQTERVVAAMKSGALDYLRLPIDIGTFAMRLRAIAADAAQHTERRRREVGARRLIDLLSGREREVLEFLSAGCSNKEIARRLEISPRTVEIHRGNMMAKLGAGHAADAVRLWIDAQSAFSPQTAEADRHFEAQEGLAGRIGGRRGFDLDRQGKRRQRQ